MTPNRNRKKDYFRAASMLKRVPNYTRLTKLEVVALFTAFFKGRDAQFDDVRFRDIALREPPKDEKVETFWDRLDRPPV